MGFKEAVAKLKRIDSPYFNDTIDVGGARVFGLTTRVARANGYYGSLYEMTYDIAEGIYRRAYWDMMMLDDIAARSDILAEELFDIAVNCTAENAGKFFQKCLNALNRERADYPDVTMDGAIGKQSLEAFNTFMKKRGAEGEVVLYRMLDGLQIAYYVEETERRRSEERHLFSWVLNRAGL